MMIGIGAFQLLYDQRLSAHVQLIENLIETEQFYIKLSVPNGDSQVDQDQKLLANLRSDDSEEKFLAVLDTIYTIRCNLFHGNKAFQPVQVTLLRPTVVILGHIIQALRTALSS